MVYQTVHLHISGQLVSLDLDDSKRNGRACVSCGGNNLLHPIGHLVGGPRSEVSACEECGAQPGTAWEPR